ncbi:GNAT family N-acetyltransferase [Micromonospora sp. WMMD882]|uniref:GNAT family N-acetyltransferase n=1 Tax=Micromonospora sp. WMMD882 TaxID=3015151 RepID=UPI00248BA6CF|nr:GNAT family N-acetyltransferase [Micromonospora sp. WMMD882]WBB81382.1 GNAT family N-acetyltransferase [Micromonospora sp. WMMD882]
MIDTARAVRGRAPLLAATGHHPYVRHVLGRHDDAAGWLMPDAVAWLLPDGPGPAGGAFGAAGPALDLFAALVADGTVRAGERLHLPRVSPDELAARLPVARHSDWDFLWTTAAPASRPGAERVVRLTGADLPELTALVAAAYPESTTHPGDEQVIDWYGIRDGDRLVACGADRSRGDVGFLAGLAVTPTQRGRGLGAALTVGMTRALFDRYDRVGLGVYTDNVGALRLYRGLGYTHSAPRSTVRLVGSSAGCAS